MRQTVPPPSFDLNRVDLSRSITITVNDLYHEGRFADAIQLGEDRLLDFAGSGRRPPVPRSS